VVTVYGSARHAELGRKERWLFPSERLCNRNFFR
jgi:hypothetical protein